MAAPLAPWLQVHPTDYLAAAKAGADVGLNIARLRSAQDERRLTLEAQSNERAAERARQADELRQRLAQQRELKMADLAMEQQRASQQLFESNAGHDLQRAGLDLREAEQAFQEGQQKLKLKSAADVAGQTASLLRGATEAGDDPTKLLELAKQNPLSPVAPGVMQKAITLKSQREIRDEAARAPKAESFTTIRIGEGAGPYKPGLNRFGSRGTVQYLGPIPEPQPPKSSSATEARDREAIHKQHLALVKDYNALRDSDASKPFLMKEINRLESQYPFLISTQPQQPEAESIPITQDEGLSLPKETTFQSGKYTVRVK